VTSTVLASYHFTPSGFFFFFSLPPSHHSQKKKKNAIEQCRVEFGLIPIHQSRHLFSLRDQWESRPEGSLIIPLVLRTAAGIENSPPPTFLFYGVLRIDSSFPISLPILTHYSCVNHHA
jgi:hypothetical protein